MDEASYEARKRPLESDLPEQIEVRVRRERRRRWTPMDKLRIVEEALAPGAVTKRVAERHEISTGLLFTWRRQLMVDASASAPVWKGRLSPAAEEIADVGIFRAKVSRSRFHNRAIDISPKCGFFALCQQQAMNFGHVAVLLPRPFPPCMLAFLQLCCRADLCRACNEVTGSNY